MNEIQITKKEYLLNKDFKIKHFGNGELVEEHDYIEFIYKDFECRIKRMYVKGPHAKNECYFGGHLCGYVKIPENNKYFNKHYDEIDIDCHGGLTYSNYQDNNYYIGFDCAHSFDYLPSMEMFKQKNEKIKQFFEQYERMNLFYPTYKNMDFCIEECKSIVDQLIGQGNEQ